MARLAFNHLARTPVNAGMLAIGSVCSQSSTGKLAGILIDSSYDFEYKYFIIYKYLGDNHGQQRTRHELQ
jgi:hypothetical protein